MVSLKFNRELLVVETKKSLAIAGLFALFLIYFSNHSSLSDKENFYFAPPKEIVHFHFGYREAIADSLWIRVVQDFDYCESEVAKKVCKSEGWVYHLLDEIGDLSSDFWTVHYFGPLMLTVVVNDMGGASKLFDRSVKLYPTDWHILYAAAYQAMIEEKNKHKAAHLLTEAAKNGAPVWLYALATKMYTEGGEQAMAQSLYDQLKQDKKFPPDILEQVKERLIKSNQ